MTLRTFLAAPAVLAFLLLAAHRQCHSAVQRGVVLVLAVLCAVQGLLINSVAQAREWSVQQHDLLLARALYAEIMREHAANDSDSGPVHVDFRGVCKLHSPYPSIPTATTGASFFEWDGGNRGRILLYMYLIGYDQLKTMYFDGEGSAAPSDFDADYASMPNWPMPGSVKRVKPGWYLVKLCEGGGEASPG
jgi:hypothetical protein